MGRRSQEVHKEERDSADSSLPADRERSCERVKRVRSKASKSLHQGREERKAEARAGQSKGSTEARERNRAISCSTRDRNDVERVRLRMKGKGADLWKAMDRMKNERSKESSPLSPAEQSQTGAP